MFVSITMLEQFWSQIICQKSETVDLVGPGVEKNIISIMIKHSMLKTDFGWDVYTLSSNVGILSPVTLCEYEYILKVMYVLHIHVH